MKLVVEGDVVVPKRLDQSGRDAAALPITPIFRKERDFHEELACLANFRFAWTPYWIVYVVAFSRLHLSHRKGLRGRQVFASLERFLGTGSLPIKKKNSADQENENGSNDAIRNCGWNFLKELNHNEHLLA